MTDTAASGDLTTGRISATPADLQQPLPAVETGRPVANRETSRETTTAEFAGCAPGQCRDGMCADLNFCGACCRCRGYCHAQAEAVHATIREARVPDAAASATSGARFCTTAGHENVQAAAVGVYDDGSHRHEDVPYCGDCAHDVMTSGEFTVTKILLTHEFATGLCSACHGTGRVPR